MIFSTNISPVGTETICEIIVKSHLLVEKFLYFNADGSAFIVHPQAHHNDRGHPTDSEQLVGKPAGQIWHTQHYEDFRHPVVVNATHHVTQGYSPS